jgi:hypothetical protein
MAWGGAALEFYKWDRVKKTPIKKVIYIDQIMKGDNKQDVLTVVSFIEGIITCMISIAPFKNSKRTMSISSDNAGCYVSKLLIIVIELLNIKYHDKIFISHLTHPDTQDGKGVVDSHFALVTRHLHHYMRCVSVNKIKQIRTPEGLVSALAWGYGVPNSIVQLIEVNRDHMGQLVSFFNKHCNELLRYIGRANEIEFVEPTQTHIDVMQGLDVKDYPSLIQHFENFEFPFKARAHSGYGNKVTFNLNLGTAKIEIDNNGMNEYCRYLSLPLTETPIEDEEELILSDDDINEIEANDNNNMNHCDDDNDSDSDLDSDFEDREVDINELLDDNEEGYFVSDSEGDTTDEEDSEVEDETVYVLEHRRYGQQIDDIFDEVNLLTSFNLVKANSFPEHYFEAIWSTQEKKKKKRKDISNIEGPRIGVPGTPSFYRRRLDVKA